MAKFPRDTEVRIQQKQAEFENVIQEHEKRHPGSKLGIDPRKDPAAREAVTRLMENNIEQAVANHTGKPLERDDLEKMKAEVRKQVDALIARSSST